MSGLVGYFRAFLPSSSSSSADVAGTSSSSTSSHARRSGGGGGGGSATTESSSTVIGGERDDDDDDEAGVRDDDDGDDDEGGEIRYRLSLSSRASSSAASTAKATGGKRRRRPSGGFGGDGRPSAARDGSSSSAAREDGGRRRSTTTIAAETDDDGGGGGDDDDDEVSAGVGVGEFGGLETQEEEEEEEEAVGIVVASPPLSDPVPGERAGRSEGGIDATEKDDDGAEEEEEGGTEAEAAEEEEEASRTREEEGDDGAARPVPEATGGRPFEPTTVDDDGCSLWRRKGPNDGEADAREEEEEGDAARPPPPRTFREWRLDRTLALQEFMAHRMGNEEVDDDDDDDGDDDERNDDDSAESSATEAEEEDSAGCSDEEASTSAVEDEEDDFFGTPSSAVDDVWDEPTEEYDEDDDGIDDDDRDETQPPPPPPSTQSRRTTDETRKDDGDDEEEVYFPPDNDALVVPFLDTQEFQETGTTTARPPSPDAIVNDVPSTPPDEQEGPTTDDAPETGRSESASSPATANGDDARRRRRESGKQSKRRGRKRRRRRKGRRRKKGDDAVAVRVPHVDATTEACDSIHDLSLRAETLNLGLCEVGPVWGLRGTKRMDDRTENDGDDRRASSTATAGELPVLDLSEEEVETTTAAAAATKVKRASATTRGTGRDRPNPLLPLSPYRDWEDDGPLSTIYRQVLSLELTQIDEADSTARDDDGATAAREETEDVIRNVAAAAFRPDDGATTEEKKKERHRRRPKKRRMRAFLYDKYARHVSSILNELRNGGKGGKTGGGGKVLMSLSGVPARCVLPHSVPSSSDPGEAMIERQNGRRAKLCLCVGRGSRMFLHQNRVPQSPPGTPIPVKQDRVNFDAEDLEVRVARVGFADGGVGGGGDREIAIGPRTVKENRLVWEGEGGRTLCGRYEAHLQNTRRREEEEEERRRAASGDGAEEEEEEGRQSDSNGRKRRRNGAVAGDRAVAISSTRNANGVNERNHKRRRDSVVYKKLADLRPTFESIKAQRQNMQSGYTNFAKIDDVVNFYGAVLGFTCPSITRRGDWMVSATVVDETLPPEPSREAVPGRGTEGAGGNGGGREAPSDDGVSNGGAETANAVGGNNDARHITVVIFEKDRKNLPKLRCAGDVLRGHRVAVQEWQNEIQLLGRRHSSFVVVRPKDADAERRRAFLSSGDDGSEAAASGGGRPAGPPPPDRWETIRTTKTFTFENDDYDRSSELWCWAQRRFWDHPTVKAEQKFTLSKMGPQDDRSSVGTDGNNAADQAHRTVNGDLTAIVASILPIPDGERTTSSPRGYLRIWDGTGPPVSDPLPINSPSITNQTKRGRLEDPPSEVLMSIADTVKELRSCAAGGQRRRTAGSGAARSAGSPSGEVNIPPPKSLCGRVVNVAVWEQTHWDLICDRGDGDGGIQLGRFVRLRNVNDGALTNGMRCLMVHKNSSLTPLPNNIYEIRSLLADHYERIKRGDPFNPSSGLLPLGVEGADSDECLGVGVETDVSSSRGGSYQTGSPQLAQNDSVMSRPGTRIDTSDRRFSTIAECLRAPAPALFELHFAIDRTYPPLDIGLRKFCVVEPSCTSDANNEERVRGKGQKMVFRFALHLRDASGELDAIVPNEVGESILGVSANDACSDDSDVLNGSAVTGCVRGTELLQSILAEGSMWNGRVQSVDFDGAKFFVLKNLVSNSTEAQGVVKCGISNPSVA